MMPGMGRMNPRQMKKMLKRQGIDIDELDDVIEVIIRMPDRTLVFDAPAVTIMKVQGQATYQIVGDPRESAGGGTPSEAAPEPPEFPEDDIRLVVDNTDADREKAIETLRECNGNPADAIIKLTG